MGASGKVWDGFGGPRGGGGGRWLQGYCCGRWVGGKETAGLGPAPLDGQERQRQNASNVQALFISPAQQARKRWSCCFGPALILGPGPWVCIWVLGSGATG